MSFQLRLLGGIALVDGGPRLRGPATQRHRLALLAILASSRDRPLGRDKVLALLWPDRETENARHLLNQSVHALRRALGAGAIQSTGDELQLSGTLVSSDVAAFEEALACSRFDQAVSLYGGPFLDGFFLDASPPFEQWTDRERTRLASAHSRALERLAESAGRSGDWAGAVEWWKTRAAVDPYDSRVALSLTTALERAGNRAGALQHALAHHELLRSELGIAPDVELQARLEELRRVPVTALSRPGITPMPGDPPSSPSSTGNGIKISRRPGLLVGLTVLLAGGLLAGAAWLGRRDGAEPPVLASPAVVDEIARAVALQLARREGGDTGRILPQHRTQSIAAYELYVRGSDPALLRSDSAARLGLEYFHRAVALDSSYAAAWIGVARMTLRTSGNGPARKAARPVAEGAVRRALAIDDSFSEAHAVFGALRGMAYDQRGAEEHLRRSIALDPSRARHREWLSNLYLATDRPADALVEAERALAIDPLSPAATAEVARALLFNDRCEEALSRLAPIRALDPPLLRVAPIAAVCYARSSQWSEGLAVIRPNAARGDPHAIAIEGYLLARSGNPVGAREAQDRLEHRWRMETLGAYDLAIIPAGLGDRDAAFEWLDRAYEDGSLAPFTAYNVGLAEPVLAGLHTDPRWGKLRQRIGLAR